MWAHSGPLLRYPDLSVKIFKYCYGLTKEMAFLTSSLLIFTHSPVWSFSANSGSSTLCSRRNSSNSLGGWNFLPTDWNNFHEDNLLFLHCQCILHLPPLICLCFYCPFYFVTKNDAALLFQIFPKKLFILVLSVCSMFSVMSLSCKFLDLLVFPQLPPFLHRLLLSSNWYMSSNSVFIPYISLLLLLIISPWTLFSIVW